MLCQTIYPSLSACHCLNMGLPYLACIMLNIKWPQYMNFRQKLFFYPGTKSQVFQKFKKYKNSWNDHQSGWSTEKPSCRRTALNHCLNANWNPLEQEKTFVSQYTTGLPKFPFLSLSLSLSLSGHKQYNITQSLPVLFSSASNHSWPHLVLFFAIVLD